MNFFQQLAALALVGTLKLTIRMDGNQQQVAILLDNEKCGDDARKGIPPLLLKGTAEELDAGFFETISQPMQQAFTPVATLPFITDDYGDELRQSEQTDNTPSCSLAEALEKQELFINSTIAQMGSALLWGMFRQGMTENRGFFLNLKEFRTMPLKIR